MTIEDVFLNHFGERPACISFVPGRVNLIGEHTDYNGGLVLPTVIAPGITVAANHSKTGMDRYVSTLDGRLIERCPNSSKIDDWSDYIGGMVDAVRTALHVTDTILIAVTSTLPAGAGVSSSAALMVAVGKVLRDLFDKADRLDDVTLARLAQQVENTYIGVPCGIMDQMAVALGKPGQALMLDTSTLHYDLVPCPASAEFVVVHSGIERALKDGRYGERRKACERAAALLGVELLCSLPKEADLSALKDDKDALGCARHVISDHYRVKEMATTLISGDVAACGGLLNDGHASLSQDFAVSTPEIDALVQSSVNLGALGARLTGGGFGGCIVALLPKGTTKAWFAQLKAKHPGIRLIDPPT